MDTGERIKFRRKELGLSADDLADRLGVSRSTIYRYESGFIEKLPMDFLEPLSQALQTTPSYIMGWDDIPGRIDKSQLADLPSPEESRERLVLMGYRYLDDTDKGIIFGEIRQMLRDEKYKDTDFTL